MRDALGGVSFGACRAPTRRARYLGLVHFPNLQLVPVTRAVLLRAAKMRARYGLRVPDAIMLATGVESGATLAITNDKTWRKVEEIDVVLLADVEA